MAQPIGKRLPPGRAKAARQAAALITHWRDKASEGGEVAVLGEVETEDDWFARSSWPCSASSTGCIKAGPMWHG